METYGSRTPISRFDVLTKGSILHSYVPRGLSSVLLVSREVFVGHRSPFAPLWIKPPACCLALADPVSASRHDNPPHGLSQAAKQDRCKISKQFLCTILDGNKRNECRHVGGVSTRSKNGAPSRKGCVANRRMTRASN